MCVCKVSVYVCNWICARDRTAASSEYFSKISIDYRKHYKGRRLSSVHQRFVFACIWTMKSKIRNLSLIKSKSKCVCDVMNDCNERLTFDCKCNFCSCTFRISIDRSLYPVLPPAEHHWWLPSRISHEPFSSHRMPFLTNKIQMQSLQVFVFLEIKPGETPLNYKPSGVIFANFAAVTMPEM